MKCFKIFFTTIIFVSILTQSIIGKNNGSIKIEKNKVENNLLQLRYEFNQYNNLKPLQESNKEEVIEKSPWLAFFLSFFLPTSGQIYNGDYTKALIQAGLMLGGGGLVTTMACVECGDYGAAQTGLLIAGAAMLFSGYIWSIIDAPASANNINDKLNYKNQVINNRSEILGKNQNLFFSSNNLISVKIKF